MIRDFLDKYIHNGDILVAAISGGPDSMCLLHSLIQYRENVDIKIICAHVNHKVRLESDEEEQFVKNYCEENNIIFEKMDILNYGNDNFHQDARKKRYDFFERLIEKYHAKFLLTAHHGDDLVESILMRIVRGSTIKGYSGFESVSKRKNYTILRPLIMETKESILKYDNENDIKYALDASNVKDVYTRNRYRKYILPQLKQEDKFVHYKFKKFSDSLLEVENYVKKQVEASLNTMYKNQKLDLHEFLKLDSFLQKRMIQAILEDVYQENIFLIHDKHTESILKLASSNKINGCLDFPQHKKIWKDRNDLLFDVNINTNQYHYIFNKKQVLPNGHVIEEINDSSENTNFICRLNLESVQFPLSIRTRKPGDTMNVKHLSGSKKINDIFTDCKVSLLERDSWPVVTDANGKIIWLPGLKKSNFDIEKDKKCDIILKYY